MICELKSIIKDVSFGENKIEKLNFYANKYIDIAQKHPMSLIYACAHSDDVNECVQLVSQLSKTCNHELSEPKTHDVISVVDYVMTSDKTNLEVIFECEKKYIKTIVGMPLIFFKVCNERRSFNKEQLLMMLKFKEKIEKNQISQHDASVDIGSHLVDKYVKNRLNL